VEQAVVVVAELGPHAPEGVRMWLVEP